MSNREWTLRSVQVHSTPKAEEIKGVLYWQGIHVTIEYEGDEGRKATVRCLNLQGYRIGGTLLLLPQSVRKLHDNTRLAGVSPGCFSIQVTNQIASSIFHQAAAAVA